jgi:gliding motility-associated-like protein
LRAYLLIPLLAFAAAATATTPKVAFVENKGQWPDQVLCRALLPGGALFVERAAFTYVLFSDSPLRHHGQVHDGHDHSKEGKAHAYRVHFEDGRANGWEGSLRQPHHENHFIGSDSTRWGSDCGVFGEVLLKEIWPGIDLRLDGRDGLKYDLVLSPGADPALIRLRFEGQEKLELRDGALVISLSTGEVKEAAPESFREEPIPLPSYEPLFHRVAVPSSYVLEGDVLRFAIERSATRALVIDPLLTFSSYSGSTGNNFGFTATYDNAGHLYGGGIVFNVGYPLTAGVLQGFFAGGTIDVGISKWSPDGASLIWSTYLGGNQAETPHSLVVNAQNELFVMGATWSANFPTTPGCFDGSFNPSPGVFTWETVTGGYGFSPAGASDVFVSRLNAAGSALLGSTFVGGSGNDGLNNAAQITHNYGDHFRGEIALDSNGNPVVATSTNSIDAPVSANAPQPAYGGGAQDGYIFRLNAALTTMLWATYYGGTGSDNALGVQFGNADDVFVCGGTTSANLPLAGISVDPVANGDVDAYVARYSAAGTALLGATYLGTSAFDQAYFVQLDTQDAVYLIGQSLGNYPVTPGKYANPGSTQFIHKLSHDLSTSLWSTRIGNGQGNQNLSPTAFLVSDCGQIYISGWASSVNNNAGLLGSTTNGCPVTTDAFQSTTDGGDHYLMVLHPDAAALYYATFFGGSQSNEHVDGGTSRFDKDGTVYQAVCAGCQNNDDFPTTPGAWSNTNNSTGCNLAVFKFSLAVPVAEVGIAGPNLICIPGTVQFTNTSSGGNTFLWDFGDGGTSTDFAPSHQYTTPGTYSVSMLMTDSYGCTVADTADLQVIAIPDPVASIEPVAPICPGGSIQVSASDGTAWSWFPAVGVSNANAQSPVITPPAPMFYSVAVTSQCGIDTATVEILWIEPTASAGPDTSTCIGAGVMLNGSGGVTYGWEPAATLSDPTIANPIATPLDSTNYAVTIITPEGCTVLDTVLVTVYLTPPTPALTDTVICAGSSVQLVAGEAAWYAWRPSPGLSAYNVQSPIAAPSTPTLYIADLINPCGAAVDSAFVDVITVAARAWPDTIICPGTTVLLRASGGITYAWSPSTGLSHPDSSATFATAWAPSEYAVSVTDANGCAADAMVLIDTYPLPPVSAGPDVVIDFGDRTLLMAAGNGTFLWQPWATLSDSASASTWAYPQETTTYAVTLTDANGCKNTDAVTVIVAGSLYLPNVFTPNGDGYNDGFGAWGKEISEIELLVFDRWGLLIWSTKQLAGRWDGTVNGADAPIDTYVWKVTATEISGRVHESIGHVTLLR